MAIPGRDNLAAQIYFMRLDGLFENLDDKDEFVRDCSECIANQYLIRPDIQPADYHIAHIQADDACARAQAFHGDNWMSPTEYFAQIQGEYDRVMAKYGYRKIGGTWRKPMTRQGFKEDLDDKDQFASYCPLCHLHQDVGGQDVDAFHTAHEEADQEAHTTVNDPLAITKNWWHAYAEAMRKRGFVRERGSWINVGAIREYLDDKDDFGPGCPFFSCQTRDDHHDFHAAHEEADRAGYDSEERQLEDDKEKRHDIYYRIFNEVMAKHGYLPEYVYGLGWWKPNATR